MIIAKINYTADYRLHYILLYLINLTINIKYVIIH